MSSAQNDRALHDMHVGDLKRVLRASSDDLRRAVEQLETSARLREDTLRAEADLHQRLQYMLRVVAQLQELQGTGHQPALTGESAVVVRDAALQALPQRPREVGHALLISGVIR